MTKRSRPPGNADRKRQFRETVRDILHMAKVKRQFGEAVDTAGAVARAMEQAYRLGFKDALKGPAASEVNDVCHTGRRSEQRCHELDIDSATNGKHVLEHLSRCLGSGGTDRDAELS